MFFLFFLSFQALYIFIFISRHKKKFYKLFQRKHTAKENWWKFSSAVPSATVKKCSCFFFYVIIYCQGIFFFFIIKKETQEVLKISTRRPFFLSMLWYTSCVFILFCSVTCAFLLLVFHNADFYFFLLSHITYYQKEYHSVINENK